MLTELLKPRFIKLALTASFYAGLVVAVGAAGPKAGDTFPDLASYKLEGKLPETLKDKVVLIDFWASWCDPCKASFPALNDFHKRYGPLGLVIIAVNVDENRADMDDFLKKNPAAFIVVRDSRQKLVEKVEVPTMPSSFLIDKDGKVQYLHSGYHGDETKKKYEKEIESLLRK